MVLRFLVLSFIISFVSVFAQCGAGAPTLDRYCNGQHVTYEVSPAANEKYHWFYKDTLTNTFKDAGYSSSYVSPYTYKYKNTGSYATDSVAMLIETRYQKEVTPTLGPVSPSATSISSESPSFNTTPYVLPISSNVDYKLNSISVVVQSYYINPGADYTFTVTVDDGNAATTNPTINVVVPRSQVIAGKIGSSSYYKVDLPLGLNVVANAAQLLSVSFGSGSDISYTYFSNTSTVLPSTVSLSSGSSALTANYGSSRPGIFGIDATFQCPIQSVFAQFEYTASKCCYGVKAASHPTIFASSGYVFADLNSNTNVILNAPFSVNLTATATSGTVFQWYKDGSPITGTTSIQSGVTSPGIYEVKTATEAQFLNDPNCYAKDKIIVQKKVLDATKLASTICFGKTTKLDVTGATGNISWTPSALLNNSSIKSPVFSPTNIQKYILRVTANVSVDNKVVDGGFSATSALGASSLYATGTDLSSSDGKYLLMDKNTALTNSGDIAKCGDHTTGSGTYLAVNAANSSTGNAYDRQVWSQTVAVTPNTAYEFSSWATNINLKADPTSSTYDASFKGSNLQYYIDYGSGFVPLFASPQSVNLNTCQWSQVKQTWNSGAISGNVTLRIVETSGGYVAGNNFGLDDVTFGSAAFQEDTVMVNVVDCMKINTSYKCLGGDSALVIAKVEDGYFDTWKNISGTNTSTIVSPKMDSTVIRLKNGEMKYEASAYIPLSNMIVNGDFEAGTTGLNTDYKPGLGGGGSYFVTQNPNNNDPSSFYAPIGDHTTGTGNMLGVDRSYSGNDRMWYQNVDVKAGFTYDFSVWFANLNIVYTKATAALEASKVLCCNCPNGSMPADVNSPNIDTCDQARAIMELVIDGKTEVFSAPFDNKWYQFRSSYTATSDKTIQIVFKNHLDVSGQNGRDFAIDDIFFAPRSNIVKKDTVTIACTLPLQFLSFEAQKSDDGAIITWSTVTGQDDVTFVIERSRDGIFFEKINQIGEKLTGVYVYKDLNLEVAGRYYYRIKQVESTGAVLYTSIKSVDFGLGQDGISIMPQPVKQGSDLLIKSNGLFSEGTWLELVSVSGSLLFKHQLVSETESISINTSDIKAGMYLLRVHLESGVLTYKILIE